MGAPPPPPPPPGSPLGCGNARMLPLPAAPAHKCGRRARVLARRRRGGLRSARAGRVLEGTRRPREMGGARSHPPGIDSRVGGHTPPPAAKLLAQSFSPAPPRFARAHAVVSRAIARAVRTLVLGLRAQTCGSSLGASGLRPLGAGPLGAAQPSNSRDSPQVCFAERLIRSLVPSVMGNAADLRRTPVPGKFHPGKSYIS